MKLCVIEFIGLCYYEKWIEELSLAAKPSTTKWCVFKWKYIMHALTMLDAHLGMRAL